MKAFGIFEGGGIKGLAHVGAVAAAEKERGTEFVGLAGTSAGAIVASLMAVGYTIDELYDPQGTTPVKGTLDISYLQFFEPETWGRFRKLEADIRKELDRSKDKSLSFLGLTTRFSILLYKHKKIVTSIVKHKGIFSTDKFIDWLEDRLTEKLLLTNVDFRQEYDAKHEDFKNKIEKIRFDHILMPLKIIATDITNKSIQVYDKELTPNKFVSDAVAASISIPLFFQPHKCGHNGTTTEMVDGGLLSNFPAWVFDKERYDGDQEIHTFGFKFASTNGTGPQMNGLMRYAMDLALTALSGDDPLQSRQIENLDIIPIRVTAGTLQFDMENDDRSQLYDRGRLSVLDHPWPIDTEVLQRCLQMVYNLLAKKIDHPSHIRVCILSPSGVFLDRLKVRCTYNFTDQDADNKLELPKAAGVAGRCWKEKQAVYADMAAARTTLADDWGLTKQLVAQVRPSLKSCLCVPIFRSAPRAGLERKMMAVLSIDSDEDLISQLSDSAELACEAQYICELLSGM